MQFVELVDELQAMTADELYDIADLAQNLATQKRRAEILKNSEESSIEFERGKLDTPISDANEVMRRFHEHVRRVTRPT